MTALPEPMTPPDCNLRGLPFMPLEVVRLMDSDLFILSTGDEFKAAVALWCKSWNQIPGGSLPDNDNILEGLSGSKTWKKVRDMALRGWVKCSDGRLYHAVVAENALQAWGGRQDHRETSDGRNERQKRWRERVKELSASLRKAGVTPPMNASLAELERLIAANVEKHVDASVSTKTSTAASTVDNSETANKGQGQGQLYSVPNGTGDKSPADKSKTELWKAAVSLLSGQGMPEAQARTFIGKLSKDYPGSDIVMQAVQGAVSEQPADARAYLKATCQRLSGERKRDGSADWTESAL